MLAWSLPLLVFAGCEPAPPPPVEEVDWAAATGPAVVRLEDGALTLDDKPIGDLREPGMLRQSRHRKLLTALQIRSGQDPAAQDPPTAALLSRGWPARLEISPQTPWLDLHPVIATSAWAGFGPFDLVVLPGGAEIGPLATDTQQAAPWAGEPVAGLAPVLHVALAPREACGALSWEVVLAAGERRQLPQRLRVAEGEPLVDCAAMFAGAPDLAGVCARARIPEATDPPALPAGQRALPVASGSGSLVPAPAGEAAVDWRPALAQALRDLGVNAAFRVELAPTHDTPVTTLAAALAAFWDLGLPPPLLALRKPPEDEPFTCQPARLQGAEAVRLAGARWLGEHRRP